MDESVSAIGFGELKRFVVEFFEKRGYGLDLAAMAGEKIVILSAAVVTCDEGEGQAELSGLWTAHVDHAFFVDELGEVVVQGVASLAETAALEVGVERHGEDVLKAIVFRAVVVAINGAILWIDAARTNDEFLGEGVCDRVAPAWVGQRDGDQVGELAIPVLGEFEERAVVLLRFGWLPAPSVGRVAVAVFDARDCGLPDIYLTQYVKSILYRNNGYGTFTDVTAKGGVSAPGWATSAV